MIQLCHDHSKFKALETEILVVGPEEQTDFEKFWIQENLPFIGIPDPHHKVLNLYNQKVQLLKFGRIPAQMIIDKTGLLKFIHYGDSMMDIPSNTKILKLLENIN